MPGAHNTGIILHIPTGGDFRPIISCPPKTNNINGIECTSVSVITTRKSSIAPTSDGGYIVGGSTSSYGAGSGDAWLLKLVVAGNLQWQKTYGGTGSEALHM